MLSAAELFLSFLTVPALSIQLLLNFFAMDRARLLISAPLRQILESAIFEPREHIDQTTSPQRVPVPAKERAVYLGTTGGLLAHEMSQSRGPQ